MGGSDGLGLGDDDRSPRRGEIIALEYLLELGHGMVLTTLGNGEHGMGVVTGHGVCDRHPTAMNGGGDSPLVVHVDSVG